MAAKKPHVPSDHILDEFLAKHGVKVGVSEFGDLLEKMRAAIVAEMSLKRWANTKDRSAHTAPARATRDQQFLDQADGDPVRAAELRREFFKAMAAKSLAVRRRNAELRKQQDGAS